MAKKIICVFKNLSNGHPDNRLLSEELGKALAILRSASIHALEHPMEHILHLQFNVFAI